MTEMRTNPYQMQRLDDIYVKCAYAIVYAVAYCWRCRALLAVLLIAFLVLVVQSGDVLQKFFSARFGHHKVAEGVSLTRTWEGLVLGGFSAMLLGSLLAWITPFSVLTAALIALVATWMGFLGSLVMTAIKRDRGVRYWGHAIVGHGGMLDRVAPVAFAAPIFYHLVRANWAVN